MNAATLCELVLVMACGLSGRQARKLPGLASVLAPVSFFMVGLAALAGALRYSGLTTITPIHLALGPIGGIALAALGGCFAALGSAWKHWGYCSYGLIAVAGGLLLGLTSDSSWRLPLSLCGLTLTLYGSLCTWQRSQRASMAGTASALSVVLAGIGIGTTGTLAGVARLDLFHLTMAVSMLAHAYALSLIAQAQPASTARTERT